MIDVKQLQGPLEDALKMLKTSTQGLPERIKALGKVTEREGEMLLKGVDKINEVNSDIAKQMKGMDDYLKHKK